MNRRILLAALAVTTACAAHLPGQAPINRTLIRPDPDAARAGGPMAAAFARARPAVVHVFVEVTGRSTFKIERPGSGVVITTDGLVLTHWALCREAVDAEDKTVFVELADRQSTRFPAEIVAHDERSGLALLRARLPDRTQLTAIDLADDPAPGDPVAVLGFHDGEDQVGFAGVAMRASGDVIVGDGDDRRAFERSEIVLTDAAIQSRSHGAALLDVTGALLGLCNAEGVATEISEPTLADLKRPSFGFVIPTRIIRSAFGDRIPNAARGAEASAQARAVARVADAVVAVHGGAGPRPEPGTDDPYAVRRRPGVGSGVVIDAAGLVLTNLHLVGGDGRVSVTFRDGTKCAAEVLSTAPGLNSALLRLRLPAGKTVTCAQRGSAPAAGATVLTVGNPEGDALAVGVGVLSATRRGALQVDAPTGNQNGGGALISMAGDLIGVVDAGPIDRIDVAFAMRGNQAKLETNLNVVPSIDALLRAHDQHTQGIGSAAPAPAGGPVAALVERTAGSMLNIYIEITTAAAELEDNPFATPEPKTSVESLGSGVVIDRSGLALTNWHVVDSATEPDGSMVADRVVRAALRDGRTFGARVLSISREEDLALLQLELEAGQSIDAVALGSSADLEIGDAAIAIGNPHGRASTVTAGIVTAKNQAIRVRGRWAKLPHLLETDAAINGGNSGGALLDAAGRLIGINSAGGSLHAVTGYAISVDHVREKLLSVLLTPEKLRSPYIGLATVDRDGAVEVHSVDPLGPGARAGIERGDVLRSIGGTQVQWSVGVATALLTAPPDRPLEVVVERGATSMTLRPVPMSAAAWALFRQAGLSARELSYQDAPDMVREVSLAFYRAFTGDSNAAPTQIPASLVRIERTHPRLAEDKIDIRDGDLLLGVQLEETQATGQAGRLIRFSTVADAQACFNAHSSYDGQVFRTWIARNGAVKLVELPARRLML